MRKLLLTPLLIWVTLCLAPVGDAVQPLELTGRVAMVGHAPHIKTVLHTPEPQTYLIAGRWLTELNNLRGATVKVRGQITNPKGLYQLPLLDIATYQILTVDKGLQDIKPWVGTLNGETTLFLTTAAGKTFELAGPLAATLNNQIGAKVWITGSCRYKGLSFRKIIIPDAYGIIRPVKM
jgi:hypothetical protein